VEDNVEGNPSELGTDEQQKPAGIPGCRRGPEDEPPWKAALGRGKVRSRPMGLLQGDEVVADHKVIEDLVLGTEQ
jgi:hypothetical protein